MIRKIKVLIVDDSFVFQKLMLESLKDDPTIEIVATACDAYQARDAILQFHPDVMTLDIEMPRMNGIEFLRQLLPQYPIPTVMVSSLDGKVFDALEAGAVDFVNKPVGMSQEQAKKYLKKELGIKIKIASTVKVSKLKIDSSATVPMPCCKKDGDYVIAIGASTGGTEAILEVIRKFQKDIPGVVIVQHMPPGFTAMYAKRLNDLCAVRVKEARTGDRVLPGQVLIAPGDAHMKLVRVGGGYQVECAKGEKVSGHCPSVDVLFESVAKVAGKKSIGVILTGMGKDGADGLLSMRKAGARTIGQDEKSCVVYGMPKVAYEIGAVEVQANVTNIGQKVYQTLATL